MNRYGSSFLAGVLVTAISAEYVWQSNNLKWRLQLLENQLWIQSELSTTNTNRLKSANKQAIKQSVDMIEAQLDSVFISCVERAKSLLVKAKGDKIANKICS